MTVVFPLATTSPSPASILAILFLRPPAAPGFSLRGRVAGGWPAGGSDCGPRPPAAPLLLPGVEATASVRGLGHAPKLGPYVGAKAKGSNLRVPFKNTLETAQAIKAMPLHRATKYLENVIAQKEIITFRYTGGSCLYLLLLIN